MQGERLEEIECERTGVVGDRAYGVLNRETGTILSAKREGRLLEASARLREGVLIVTLPTAEEYHLGSRLDDALTAWLGYSVTLTAATTFGIPTFESPEDFEHDDSRIVSWEGTSGRFVDESALHVLTTSNLEQLSRERPELNWDVRRFRPNVVVDDRRGSCDARVGRRLRTGDVDLLVVKQCSRCVMTTRPQPGGLERELDILRHVSRQHGGDVGVRAAVERGGAVRVGDEVLVA